MMRVLFIHDVTNLLALEDIYEKKSAQSEVRPPYAGVRKGSSLDISSYSDSSVYELLWPLTFHVTAMARTRANVCDCNQQVVDSHTQNAWLTSHFRVVATAQLAVVTKPYTMRTRHEHNR